MRAEVTAMRRIFMLMVAKYVQLKIADRADTTKLFSLLISRLTSHEEKVVEK
jgi:hypothetical protein